MCLLDFALFVAMKLAQVAELSYVFYKTMKYSYLWMIEEENEEKKRLDIVRWRN